MKGTPYLNPDPFCHFIGPKNWGEVLIDDKLTTCLLDNGSQLNFVTPAYAHERGMDILSLDTLAKEIGGQLPPIAVMGAGMVKPEGFVIMNVRVPCVRGYNEDQIAIVLEDPEMKDCPVVLGTPTLFRVMEVIKESEISKLAVPWASSRLSWLIPTWMGYPATWRVRCVSVTEASKIVTTCKRLERENWRRACWELQHRFSTMRLGSTLSADAKPFQPQTASSLMLVASPPQGPVDPAGPRESSPAAAATRTPVCRGSPVSHHASDEGETSPDTSNLDRTPRRRRAGRGNRSRHSGSDSDDSHASAARRKKKDGFSSKTQIPEFGGKKGHPQDVASAFRQWARCITYYRDYYEDSYLMPLVVSSLTGDASDVFDWTQSLMRGDPQDLSALLQMLREHYCGSFMFREQRNMVKNLHQGAQEDATDFMIRVGTSVSNLDKDWWGQLSQAELESLQYEVSLNGVRQEIRHILDSEVARRGPLTPHQMYEAVKKYETYVARNKRLEGRGSSPSTGQQKTAGQTSNYKLRFHRTTAFAATVEESEAQVDQHQEAQPTEEGNPSEAESSLDDDDGLYIPSYLEEAAPNDPVLQVRLARAMQALEKETRRCYRCNQQGHLQKDCKEPEEKNGRGPLSLKGPF